MMVALWRSSGVNMNRRQVVSALAGSVALPRLAVSQAEDGYIVLTAEKAEMALLKVSNQKTPVWRFAKEKPMAVLRAKQGQEFKGRLINKLDQELWLHWFGVRANTEAMTIVASAENGNSVDIKFTPPDAGTFWFGPLINASLQRDMGLYGMLIVEELSPQDFNDVPLILDDWKIDDAGKMVGSFNDLQDAIGEGRLGNWFTVNGANRPHIKVANDKPIRLRVLNAANVRTMNVLFKGAELFVIALDGQPVAVKPIGQDALKLTPGQRVDLLLATLNSPITIELDLQEDAAEIGFLEPEGSFVAHDLPDNFALPANPLSVLGDLTLARAVTVTIAGGAKGGLKSAMVGTETLDTRALLQKGLAWAFNGIAGTGGPALFEAKKGETVLLTIDNTTAFPQPLHIHGHVWQVVEAGGQALEAQPWRDTAVVPGLSQIKLAFVADNVGLWALQSLLAERSDAGLLGAFTVSEV